MILASTRSKRACDPCRSAKAKCDGKGPICSRCARRSIPCTGLQPVLFRDDAVFRNENEVARLSSMQARQARRERPGLIPLEIVPVSETDETDWPSRSRSAPIRGSSGRFDERASIPPEPLPRDRATRAVERFFVDWVSHSREDGFTPKKQHQLPILYSAIAPGSVLWLAVRALAFAHVSNSHSISANNSPTALELYGNALSGLQSRVHNNGALSGHDALAAILVLDTFEMLYLGREELLGPPGAALQHILQSTNETHRRDASGLNFLHTAHHRLLARQLLLREKPLPEQDMWFTNLDPSSGLQAMSRNIYWLVELSGKAHRVAEAKDDDRADIFRSVNLLLQESAVLLTALNAWKVGQQSAFSQSLSAGSANGSFASFITMSSWNFYYANEIMARESIIELLETCILAPEIALNAQFLGDIQAQREIIQQLSQEVLNSTQALTDLLTDATSPIQSSPQGRMAIKSSIYASMSVLRMATSVQHHDREAAEEVIRVANSLKR